MMNSSRLLGILAGTTLFAGAWLFLLNAHAEDASTPSDPPLICLTPEKIGDYPLGATVRIEPERYDIQISFGKSSRPLAIKYQDVTVTVTDGNGKTHPVEPRFPQEENYVEPFGSYAAQANGFYTLKRTESAVPVSILVGFQGEAKTLPLQPNRLVGFPQPTPITEADPGIRQQSSVQIPSQLKIVRSADRLSVALDSASLETVKLEVGANMVLGAESREWIYPASDPRPASPRGITLSGSPAGIGGAAAYTEARDGMPKSGVKYMVEIELSIFETDIPPQHDWMPQSPKYKVLWKRTLKRLVD